jgi:hypothetical protein
MRKTSRRTVFLTRLRFQYDLGRVHASAVDVGHEIEIVSARDTGSLTILVERLIAGFSCIMVTLMCRVSPFEARMLVPGNVPAWIA